VCHPCQYHIEEDLNAHLIGEKQAILELIFQQIYIKDILEVDMLFSTQGVDFVFPYMQQRAQHSMPNGKMKPYLVVCLHLSLQALLSNGQMMAPLLPTSHH
jgi:hypothetical protein